MYLCVLVKRGVRLVLFGCFFCFSIFYPPCLDELLYQPDVLLWSLILCCGAFG